MTRRELSDSTLDALAQGRKDAEAAVSAYLSRSRLLAWQVAAFTEPPLRLTSRHPAPLEEDTVTYIEATQVGADLSKALIDYLDGSRGHFPVHDALLLWDRECRRRHARWPDHRGRPICSDIAWAVLRDRTSLQWAAEQAGVSWTRAERLLLSAVEFCRRRQERWISDVGMSATHDREYCAVCRAEAV